LTLFVSGYFVSCAAGSLNIALEIMAPIIIPIMLFGGLFINLRLVA
jgi:hypothetical protein